MALTQGIYALLAGHSTCRMIGPARAAAVALLVTVAALPRPLQAGRPARPQDAAPAAGTAAKLDAAAASDTAAIELISRQIREGWKANGLEPSAAASDGEWCRRVYLDLIGRVPTVAELQQYFREPQRDRKEKLVDRLLGEEYTEEYARNWTTLWTNTLIGRSGGTDRRSPISRVGLQQSLRRALQRNIPYNDLVRELVEAQGVGQPGEENFNGFVNFVAAGLEEKAVLATAKTSQIFLGLRIQCSQCHDHPFASWKQHDFWEFNAFFRQSRVVRVRRQDTDLTRLENVDFRGDDGQADEAALYFELPNGRVQAAYPEFIDGVELPKSGLIAEVDRRSELAKMIVGSEYFAPAIVNRTWAHFFGYGFTKPIDDMGENNPPSHPDLLAGLAKQFKENRFDLKQLMRWIVLSEPYGLSSVTKPRNKSDDPLLGARPQFSHFYLRQLRAEELYESLLTATEADGAATSYEMREDQKRQWLDQFTLAFGTDDNEETTTFNGTIPQALMMMNGDLVSKATSIEKGSFLARIATDPKMSNAERIRYLYLAALARQPSKKENELANVLLRLRKYDAVAALQDVWWALLNSNEFILNH